MRLCLILVSLVSLVLAMSGKSAAKDFFAFLRNQMVEHQIVARGIADPAVLASMSTVPRHEFVSEELRHQAYDDNPLPIGNGQTISQPFIVAYMAEAAMLKSTNKILEIGTGCDYSASVLSNCVHRVYSVETIQSLADESKRRLESLGYNNVFVFHSDGTVGLEEFAPYDAIIVTASGPTVPSSLKKQLNMNGRMIIPVCTTILDEQLIRVTRRGPDSFEEEALMDVCFVPLIGKEGWQP